MTVAMRWMTPFPNLFLGLTPVISYKSALEAANAATYVPLNRLLLETDAPYFVPSKVRKNALNYVNILNEFVDLGSSGCYCTVAGNLLQQIMVMECSALMFCFFLF